MSDPISHSQFDKSEQEIIATLEDQGEHAIEGQQALPSAEIPEANAPAAVAVETPASAADSASATATDPTTAAVAPVPSPSGGDKSAALRASRHAEKRLRSEVERLGAENEALKAGKGHVSNEITDAEIDQLEEDFPLQAKLARETRDLKRRLDEQQRPIEQAATEFAAWIFPPQVQELIDAVPKLLEWQYDPAAQDKFERAVDYDKSLIVDPDWKDKSPAERFNEAVRRTEAALSPNSNPSAAQAAVPAAASLAARIDPAAAVAAALPAGPQGISDFRGGAPAATTTGPNFKGMTDEQIMASLPGG